MSVTNAHLAADYEVMAEAGLEYLRHLARSGARVVVPTSRNATCVDFDCAVKLHQQETLVRNEREVGGLLSELGIEPINSCIVYQTHYRPSFGEHLAWGDTGTVAYANGITGARTNYESGPAALSAALTGRTPAYGFHLDECRRGTIRFHVEAGLDDFADWGVLGAIVGEGVGDYWSVPIIELDSASCVPSDDHLKHFCASFASYGSGAMFHIVGVTPEAADLSAACYGGKIEREVSVSRADIDAFYRRYPGASGKRNLVVFTAPQLSASELRQLGGRLNGRRFGPGMTVIATTNTRVFEEIRLSGDMAVLREAGMTLLKGVCWYLMDPAAMRAEFKWKNVVTNSAKLANIIQAHGYSPVLRTTDECIDIACSTASRS